MQPRPDAWKPSQYDKFRAERERPFHDLLAFVRRVPGMRVVDLGCGTGKLTRELHERLTASRTLGIDSSEAMLAGTGEFQAEGLRFQRATIESFGSGPEFDLVFSNAALHWVPDHESLLARLARSLTPRGQLAIQVPANEDHAAYRIANEVAREEPFRTALGGFLHRSSVLAPESYALILERLGFAECQVRLNVYVHRLPSVDAVVEWVKGAMLTDFESRLAPARYAEFVARYRERILSAFPPESPTLFTFKRILLWGTLEDASTS
ncbi:MAG: methyltransferase domain-containing protein [Thermoanaerobaculia bacterium]